MVIVISFILGALFSTGLAISGMVNPNKVIGFLDIFGDWDPALAFVMAGGVLLNFVLFKFILKRNNPVLTTDFSVLSNKDVDKRLIIGSALFGIGWGIGGVCPGPGLANLFLFDPKAIVFVVFMLIGMFLFNKLNKA
jgi:uncharacterized membrane protein YedE/YeeE